MTRDSHGTQATVRRKLRSASVPDAVLENCELSFPARIVLAWALGRQDGFEVWIWYMCKQLGLSDKSWSRVRRELIAAGFFIQRREKGEDGKFIWTNEFTDEPLLFSLIDNEGIGRARECTSTNPKSGPAKKPKSKASGPETDIPGWLSRLVVVDVDNAADLENVREISRYPRDLIESAAAKAKAAAPSGRAYPTATLRFLVAAGAQPKPKPLSEWALAAQAVVPEHLKRQREEEAAAAQAGCRR